MDHLQTTLESQLTINSCDMVSVNMFVATLSDTIEMVPLISSSKEPQILTIYSLKWETISHESS